MLDAVENDLLHKEVARVILDQELKRHVYQFYPAVATFDRDTILDPSMQDLGPAPEAITQG